MMTRDEIERKADDIIADRKFAKKCLNAFICKECGDRLYTLAEYGGYSELAKCRRCNIEYQIFY